jgi:hypothetical protein
MCPRFGHWRISCRVAEASDAGGDREPEENTLTAEKIESGRRLLVRFPYARADLAFTL